MRETPAGPPAGAEVGEDLRRELGLLDVAAIHVGNILGSGIFVAPAAVAAAAAGALPGAGLWLLGGIIATAGAACYAECGTRMPRTGGFYVYYRAVYGPQAAFVGGWAALLVTYPCSIAAVALVFSRYLGEIAPWTGTNVTIPAAAALALAGMLNMIGVRAAAWIQRVLTGVKVAALAAVCLAALLASESAERSAAPATGINGTLALSTLLGAMVVLLWTYDGWSDISLAAGEIRDPGRVLGRAVIAGTALLIVVYVIVQTAVVMLLPPARAASSERVLAEAVQEGLGPGSAALVALLVVIATFGCCHGIVLTSSRLAYAMARDGVFFRWFGRVHPRFGTPARSVAVITIASILYVFATGFRNLLAFFSFSVWIFYGLTAVALLILRRRRVGEPVAWRAPGGPAAPAIILLVAACMTAGLTAEDPRRSLLSLALLLAGFPAYAIWRALLRRREGRTR